MKYRQFQLFPFQEEAIQAIEGGRSVIVSAPTGAGKTLIAEYAIERSLALGRRCVYTSPIKALSNQKYRDFQRAYGDRIGIMTGDVTLNPDAPVLIMTTEIFRNTIFTDASRLRGITHVIFDEVHYISDPDRGTVWEESIIFAPPEIKFVGLSATISNLEQFRAWIAKVRGEDVSLVSTTSRPVPLRHLICFPEVGVGRIGDFGKLMTAGRGARRGPRRRGDQKGFSILRHLQEEDLLPALYFCFSRREVEGRARRAKWLRLLARPQRERILAEFDALCERFELEDDGGVREMRELASRGVLYHHAGLLPVYKEIVERLFTTGMVRLLFATETFALGVNMPARSVLFSSLRKFNGVSFDYLTTLGYYQMAGRAGRQGLDEEGTVFSLVNPEFDDQKSIKKVVFGKVEALISRFNLAYSAILNLYELLGDDIGSAADRSFAAFQRGGKADKERALLNSRLDVLEKQGFIKDGKLSGKGRIAARLNGYETQMVELYWSGCFQDLSPVELAVMVMGVIYEPRKGEVERLGVETLGAVKNRARKRIQEFRRAEKRAGIEEQAKAPHWGLSGATMAWAEGAPMDELYRYASGQPGDVVRSFRMAVQVLRQFAAAVSEDRDLVDRLREALERLNRDEVDAERQIRLGND